MSCSSRWTNDLGSSRKPERAIRMANLTAWIALLPDEHGVEKPLVSPHGGALMWYGANEAAVWKLPNAPRSDARLTPLLAFRDTTSPCARVQLLRMEAAALTEARGTPYMGTPSRAWRTLAEKAIALAAE